MSNRGRATAAAAVVLAAAAPCLCRTAAAAPAPPTNPNLDAALATQQEMVRQQLRDPGAWNDLGNLLVLEGEPEAAEEAYRRAIEFDPGYAPALYNMGLLAQERHDLREAERLYRSTLEIDQRFALAHFRLGMLFEARQKDRKAVREMARAFRIDPGLSMPEGNPEVLDTHLATWAVMEAYLNPLPGRSARQYAEAARIAGLLVGEIPPPQMEPGVPEEPVPPVEPGVPEE